MEGKKILLGSDKGGFYLKEAIKEHLISQGYEIEDIGTQDVNTPVLYYEVGERAGKKISSGEFERGILVCGTGMGMAITANKFEGVYAAVCESTYSAEKCREINDANILTMGAWMIGPVLGCAMADVFLGKGFTQGVDEERAAYLKKAKENFILVEKKAFGR